MFFTKGMARAVCGMLILLGCSNAAAQQRPMEATSSIDWQKETIHSVLSLDTIKTGIQLPSGRNSALQILEMETPALLKDTFFSILVDSSSLLGDSVERGEISLGDLNRIIDTGKRTPPWVSPDLKKVSMTHAVDLADIGSLFIHHTAVQKPKPILDTIPSRAFSGILIDARSPLPVHGEYEQAILQPCLFPRIWNSGMELLYEKNMVKPEIAKKQGIALYSSNPDESAYRDVIGDNPLRVSARQIFGTHHTDPIISNDDYLRIMTQSENRDLLANGKVVILCSEESLESRGIGPRKDDAYYFAWKDVGERLSAREVKKIDFSDSWKGLKLTIYDIRFVADTARILPEERGRLDVIAEALLLAGPRASFLIEGHTASVGKPAGETALSVDRALTIAKELQARGIAAERIHSAGFGGTKPVANNDTDEGRALNRRVEITIQLPD